MSLLFVNACMRENSRTERLARMVLQGRTQNAVQDVVELRISDLDMRPLDQELLAAYSASVSQAKYDHPMFAYAKQFAEANSILIAAPFWNFSIPAKLHDYLELVCSQGITFDVDSSGAYVSLCKAKSLVFVCTSGGVIGEATDDHAFGYVRTLARQFWHISQVECVMAQGLDAPGANVEALLEAASRA